MQSKETLRSAVSKHASVEVKLYAVHAYVFCGFNKKTVALVFNKHRNTISTWIKEWNDK
jgi:transposase